MGITSTVDPLILIKERLDAVYAALGRRTVVKYSIFNAWNLARMNAFGTAYNTSYNSDNIMRQYVAASMLYNALMSVYKYDLTNVSTVSFDVEVGGGSYEMIAAYTIASSSTYQSSVVASPAVSAGSRRWIDIDVSAVDGRCYLGWRNYDMPAGWIKLYGIKLDGISIPIHGMFTQVDGTVALPTGELERKMYSSLIVGSYAWDTIEKTISSGSGSVQLNILDKDCNTLIENVSNLADLSDMDVDRVILEALLSRPSLEGESPVLKELWISYL